MSKTTRSWLVDLSFLIIFTSLLYGLFLGMRPLTPPDEGRYSEIPREMVVMHDYLTPHLDGVQYFEKPVLFYWMQVVSIKLFGLHEWSLRLINALMGALGGLVTYMFTRKLYSRRVGLLAGTLLCTSLLYAFLSRFITLDITMTFFLTGSLLFFILGNHYPAGRKRQYCMWGMFLFAALATMTKGLIGILFPGMIIFTWLLLTREWQRLSTYCLASGSILFLIITVPWHVMVGLKNPGFFSFYFYEQHFLRYLTHYAGREQAIWFLPSILLLGWFPWTGFMLAAISKYCSAFKNPKQNLTEIYLFIWPTLIFIFYWLSHSQLSPYLLPMFPPLAILTARYLDDAWNKKTKVLQFNFIVIGILNLAMAIGLLIFLKQNHLEIPTTSRILLIITAFLSAILCNVIYRRYSFHKALITLFVTNACFSLIAYYTSSFFNGPSVKHLSLELRKVIRPDDVIYNYNHYFQDMPVYLERPVVLLNWKGELQFGYKHNPPVGTFLHENRLWDNWQDQQRKFVVMTTKDFLELRSVLKTFQFYPLACTKKFVLICNKDVKQ